MAIPYNSPLTALFILPSVLNDITFFVFKTLTKSNKSVESVINFDLKSILILLISAFTASAKSPSCF